VVTDFSGGERGDRLELGALLAATSLPAGANPFATGHLALVRSGGDTLVQIDRDGAGTASSR
jgi:hypothetical protein